MPPATEPRHARALQRIKHLHLGVYPPDGRVRVAAPLAVDDEAVRLAVVQRLGWIRPQQAQFAAQPRESRREMVSGESHQVFGQRRRLRVVEVDAPPKVERVGLTTLRLQVRPGADRDTSSSPHCSTTRCRPGRHCDLN